MFYSERRGDDTKMLVYGHTLAFNQNMIKLAGWANVSMVSHEM